MGDHAYDGVIRYHEQTKHHFRRFARSLGYMDWKNQPNPFRSYEGAESVPLPLLKSDPPGSHLCLYERINNRPQDFSLGNIAAFLELSLGLSAWKAIAGSQWSLRINPSSGNLHPTECHLILPAMAFLGAGVFHYNPFQHALELRSQVAATICRRIADHFAAEGFLVALSSIFWRESWKYGERGFRYCNHDIGHALACLSFSANLQGWKIKYLNTLSDEQTGVLLGFDRVKWTELEEEHPELLCFVCGNEKADVPRHLQGDLITDFSRLSFNGDPNVLSEERARWDIINEVSALTKKPATPEQRYQYGKSPWHTGAVSALTAAGLIRRRRSAVSFSGEKSLERDQFLAILDRTIPRDHCAPFDVELMEPCVHLLIFVHSVSDLQQGLYFFIRNSNHIEEIQHHCRSGFQWKQIEQGLPLYFLKSGNFRQIAARVSCDQDIAGYGVLSLGMVARFRPIVQQEPFRYRHLFWEAGMIGQILYLEAEANGLRATGIGCFYDDSVHEIMGLGGNSYQSLYHFTIGDPVEDTRLKTYPPYAHLRDRGVA
ncbi:MAG: SagB/ThcOx family dehydrogenase [Desulforhabdus sp.]|jgi:SagB-type dehydrogenase family enzyme|nr:SagB/ThcOx family dehydrogenase [Desulforhabdus sp.]